MRARSSAILFRADSAAGRGRRPRGLRLFRLLYPTARQQLPASSNETEARRAYCSASDTKDDTLPVTDLPYAATGFTMVVDREKRTIRRAGRAKQWSRWITALKGLYETRSSRAAFG